MLFLNAWVEACCKATVSAPGLHALVLCAIATSSCGIREDSVERLLRQAALSNPRPVEGRLSSDARYAPWNGLQESVRHKRPPIVDDDDHRILRGSRSASRRQPDELHRLGLLHLYFGEAARAVSLLEAAAERNPTAVVLSDLAAAYLYLAHAGRPWLRVDAIEAASRAVGQAPNDPFATFNLALALERMSLKKQSSLVWNRYITLEEEAPWSREAYKRLRRLDEQTTTEHWKTIKNRFVSAASTGDLPTLAHFTRRFPKQVRDFFVMDLLVDWANAVGTPSEKALLAIAKRVADNLATLGSRLYAEAIEAIEDRGVGVQSLVNGHRAYARGLELRRDCLKAVPAFERAEVELSAGSSPLAWAARLELLVCTYRRRPLQAEVLLRELASDSKVRAYPVLLTKAETMLGLSAMARGRHSQAIAHYERAAELSKNSGETELMRLHGMLDEAHRFLGDRDTAWRYRSKALRGAAASGDRQIRHSILAGLARELVEANRDDAAHAVLDEMLSNARAWSEPGAVGETLLRRIQLHLRRGANNHAAADIAACAETLEQFQQPGDRERLEIELALASAEHKLKTNPNEAQLEFARSLARLNASDHGLLLPRTFLGLASAHLALGEPEPAEAALGQALKLYEDRRVNTVGEWHRITFFATAQPSFDAMIRFQALDRGDPHTAFVYSEQVRARGLRDHIPAEREPMIGLQLYTQLDRIPANVAIVAFAVLPEELLVWQLRQGRLNMHIAAVPRAEVAELVASLRIALGSGDSPEATLASAARAFDLLLRPAISRLPTEMELVFVPDRELHQVPFAALFDELSGRYLIQDHSFSVVPSLEVYLTSIEIHASATSELRRVVSVGDPAFDSERFQTLVRLPYARAEALAVAALYEDHRLLIGKDATRQRVLDALPGADVLHLAAHVVFDPSSPLSSVVATADFGRAPLRISDLNAERLANVKLVFLAACDTAPGFSGADREGVAGFVRAVLAAKVPLVVATLWPVEDQAAAQLAQVFHSRILEGESPANALRVAQLALLSDPSASGPFAWAPFQLYRSGDTRRKP